MLTIRILPGMDITAIVFTTLTTALILKENTGPISMDGVLITNVSSGKIIGAIDVDTIEVITEDMREDTMITGTKIYSFKGRQGGAGYIPASFYTLSLILLFSFRFPPATGQSVPLPASGANTPPACLASPSAGPPSPAIFHLSADAYPSAAAPPFASMEKDILRLVNQYRRSKRLPPLQINQLESRVAGQHSQDMASGRTPFGHEGFKQRAAYLNKKMGPIRLVAENVASGQMSASEVVDGWLHSPGHRRNIEGDFRLTGIGLARGSRGMIYFTQIFTR